MERKKKTPVGAHGEILWMLVEFCFCAFYSAVPARPQISLDSVRNDTANPPALRIMRIRTKQVLHYGRKLEIQKTNYTLCDSSIVCCCTCITTSFRFHRRLLQMTSSSDQAAASRDWRLLGESVRKGLGDCMRWWGGLFQASQPPSSQKCSERDARWQETLSNRFRTGSVHELITAFTIRQRKKDELKKPDCIYKYYDKLLVYYV